MTERNFTRIRKTIWRINLIPGQKLCYRCKKPLKTLVPFPKEMISMIMMTLMKKLTDT